LKYSKITYNLENKNETHKIYAMLGSLITGDEGTHLVCSTSLSERVMKYEMGD